MNKTARASRGYCGFESNYDKGAVKILRDMKIGTKLIGAFSILVILFAVGMTTALYGLKEASAGLEELYRQEFQIVQLCKDLQRNIQSLAINMFRTYAAALNDEKIGEADAAKVLETKTAGAKASLDDIKAKIDKLGAYKIDDDENFKVIADSYPALFDISNQIFEDYNSGRISEGMQLASKNFDAIAIQIGVASDALAKSADARATEKCDETILLVRSTRGTCLFLCILLTAASTALCAALTRSITKPLKAMENAAKKVADGYLTPDVHYESKNEIGSLVKSMCDSIGFWNTYIAEIQTCLENIGNGKLNYKSRLEFKGDFISVRKALDGISEKLTEALLLIYDSAEQVTAGTEQIAASAQALSQATMNQSNSVEEFSVTINDVSAHALKNADNAVISSQLTEAVGETVEKNSERVQALSGAMTEMREMSGKITGIIKDIEVIAFQTNILSLNAAVEAARAGESGRGFSVVANEIRSLAAKTTEASKTTSELIGKTVEMMVRGSDMADEISEKLHDAVKSAREAAGHVHSISLASNEQASAVVRLRESIERIAAVIQENAATAEESAAASQELTGQMQVLKRLVDSFEFDSQRS